MWGLGDEVKCSVTEAVTSSKKTPIDQGKEHVNLVGILLVTYRDLSHFLFLFVHIPSQICRSDIL